MDKKTKYKTLSDNALLSLLSENEPIKSQAFNEIYERYSQRVYLYCRKILGDGNFADDVFQETFIKFLKYAEAGNTIDNLLGFLLKIARNLCLNHKKSIVNHFVEIEEFHQISYDRNYENEELSQLISDALEILPEAQKEAFVLQSYEGLSYNEISELMEVPLTTVRNWIVRSKKKLREVLSPYMEGR